MAALAGATLIYVRTTQNGTTICLSRVTLLIFETAAWKLPPQDNGSKRVRGVSLKSRLLESNRARRNPRSRHVWLACHVSARKNSGAGVWRRHRRPPSLFARIHYLGNRKRRKLLIKDLPTLWLLQAVCRHLKPSVSSPLKGKKKQNSDILISRQRKSSSWQQPNSPATGEGGREGERERKRLGENNAGRHIWRYIYTFSRHDEPIFDVF